MKRVNRVGEIYGFLTVIEFAGTDKKQSIWKCRCECGNIVNIKNDNLVAGKTKSCGCLRKKTTAQNSRIALKKRTGQDLIEGTSIQAINRQKLISTNTSGVTGVFFDSTNKTWRAVIEFKGKRHSLGSFKEKEDAIKARKEAEERIYKPFLEKVKK